MNVWILLAMGFLAGAAAGAVFLAGLWWTTRRLPGTGRPAGLFVASYVVRMAVLLGVFYLLARPGRWELLAAGLVGFTVVRIAAVRRVKGRARKETG
ncbi:MAG: ATP synthase subunit I [Planctomycetota bacterium]